jgi:glycosyltransferase involved in cell wall biosynthesis
LSGSVKRFVQLRQFGKARNAARTAGDEARDRQDWKTAEAEYRAHLAISGDDQPIWVQLGHCLKEQAQLAEAEAAYRKAITLNEKDADAYLQLGHVLKLRGQMTAAEAAYGRSFELQPSKAAYDEMVGVSDATEIANAVTLNALHDNEDTVYLEVDDLLDYLKNHKTLSGIQRVQVGVVNYALRQLRTDNKPYAFVRTGKHGSGFWKLDPDDLEKIIDYVSQAVVSQSKLLSLISAAEQHALQVEPVAMQTYFILGAFWGFGSNAARYTRLKIAGVRIGVYIYDLIPITHPEYCATGLVSEFYLALADGLTSFDFILTISDFVAKDVRRFLEKHDLRRVPVEPILLAHQLHDRSTPKKVPVGSWRGAIAPLEKRPFVLMVSTIEARKNHIYLYTVWKALIEEGLDVPDLVFVGRFGWRVNDLRDMLEGTEFLGGRIHVLHDLSDTDLEQLYQSCLFTAFPSVIEGWGLPVGESLAHGRPCVASSTSSIPEVGGDLVDYIDPWNVRDGVRVFKKMIFDEAYRARRVEDIAQRFVARTWDDVGRDLLGRLESLSTSLPATRSYKPPLLAAGELLIPGEISVGQVVASNYASRPLRPVMAEGWYPSERFGCWMRGERGSLWFLSDQPPGTHVSIYIHILGAPWSSDHQMLAQVGRDANVRRAGTGFPATVGKNPSWIDVVTTKGFLCRTSGLVEEDGTIYVELKVRGPEVKTHAARGPHDDRVFYIGFSQLGYGATANSQTRVDLLEHFAALG